MRALVKAPTDFGSLLRGLVFSPSGRRGDARKKGEAFPLPLPCEWREALRELVGETYKKNRSRPGRAWFTCEMAWCGLMLMGLNWSHSFTATVGCAANPMHEKVLELISRDAAAFVKGDGLGKNGERAKAPEVPWSSKIDRLKFHDGHALRDKEVEEWQHESHQQSQRQMHQSQAVASVGLRGLLPWVRGV